MAVSFIILQVAFIVIALVVNTKYSFKLYKWFYVWAYILYIPIVSYLAQFWQFQISENPSDWGVFGDFMGGTYNVLISLFVAYISYRVTKIQKRDEYSRNVAQEILKQVKSMKTKKYHHYSIDKLRRQTKDNEIYIGKLLKENLVMLADNYVQVKSDNAPVITNLEQAVINELKSIANE